MRDRLEVLEQEVRNEAAALSTYHAPPLINTMLSWAGRLATIRAEMEVDDAMLERALSAYARHAEQEGFDRQTPEMAAYRRGWLRAALAAALRADGEG